MEILFRYHDDRFGGHHGAERTLKLIRRHFHWERLDAQAEQYVRTCDICQRMKAKHHRPYGVMVALPRPERPFQELTMDFITGLPPSKLRGSVSNAILVFVDRFTKLALYLPTTKDIDSPGLADLFFDAVIRHYGMPKGIVSDRGSIFTSEFWEEVCRAARVKRRLSTAFHPQTDGQTEIRNKAIRAYLQAFCSDEQATWAPLLAWAEFAHNSAFNATIGCSPFQALYSYEPELYYNIGDNILEREAPEPRERVRRMHEAREKMVERWRIISKT